MKNNLGQIPDSSVIYIPEGMHESAGVSKEDYVKEYKHWHLILQPQKKRDKRGKASGLVVAKRKVMLLTELLPEEWADLSEVMKDAPKQLCIATGTTFTGHFTGPAFNNGSLAGQTQAQVHGHIYPVIEEDLPGPGVRNGMGAMIEAHREKNR